MAADGTPIHTVALTRDFRAARKRDRVRALDSLDLRVEPGEVVGLLGPNGSGKSTTMKLLLGLLRPTSGRAALFGRPAGDKGTLRRVGYLPEETRLYGFLDPRETIRFFAGLAGVPRRERAREADRLIEEFGLADVARRRVAGFSKGMRRRLGFACALAGRPDLLILDEPNSGLDPLGAAEAKARILRLKEEGRTVLLSSHLLADVRDVCDRLVLLGNGRLIRDGSPDELLMLKDEWEVRFKSGEPGFADRVREFVLAGGAEEVQVRHATEELEGLFLRLFREH